MNSNTFNSFCRHRTVSFLMRGDKVIIGLVDDIERGDLRITGDVGGGFLRVASFDGTKWRQRGGLWDGRLHSMLFPIAELMHEAIKHLRLHEFLVTASASLKAAAMDRLTARVEKLEAIAAEEPVAETA